MNIGSNAVKYNHDGGSVTVTCREISYTDTIAEYELTCTDTGIGMSEEFQKRAFEPFAQEGQSARTKYAGTGLGLAIARKLTELQEGTLLFESIQGKGTKFICAGTTFLSTEKRTAGDRETKTVFGKVVRLASDCGSGGSGSYDKK